MASVQRDDGFYWVNIPGLDSFEEIGGGKRDGWNSEKFSITNITVARKANAIRSPIETGYQVFDNKVIMPIEVTMSAMVKAANWQEIWDILQGIYDERSYNFYTVYTRGEIVKNLMLTEVTREETTDKFDAVDLTLHFVQVVYATEKGVGIPGNTFDKKDENTKQTGQKTLTDRLVGSTAGFFTGGISGMITGAL